VYLPRGTWTDFWTEERVDGGREIARAVDLGTMPLYVRAGATLPIGPVKQYVEARVDEPLALVVYPGADAASTWYEDDGRTFGYRNGAFMRVAIDWRDAARRLSLRLAGGRMLPPTRREIVVRVAGERATRAVAFDGRDVRLTL
jgi:alpha-glucosidase (family GH31 glycosyl hydrolase)